MRYQRTQVYLEPDDHRRLAKEARDRGISLAALLRRIVSAHVSEGAPTYEPKSFDAITGIFDSGGPVDARELSQEMARAMERRYAKTMGAAQTQRTRRTAKRPPRR